MKGIDNIADIGTRGAKPVDIGLDSEWQNGPDWLKWPISEWPIDRAYRESIPEEEIPKVSAMAVRIVQRD